MIEEFIELHYKGKSILVIAKHISIIRDKTMWNRETTKYIGSEIQVNGQWYDIDEDITTILEKINKSQDIK